MHTHLQRQLFHSIDFHLFKVESKVRVVVFVIVFSANRQTDYSNSIVLTIPSHPFPNHSDPLKLCQHHYKYLNHFPPRSALPLSRQLKITKKKRKISLWNDRYKSRATHTHMHVITDYWIPWTSATVLVATEEPYLVEFVMKYSQDNCFVLMDQKTRRVV